MKDFIRQKGVGRGKLSGKRKKQVVLLQSYFSLRQQGSTQQITSLLLIRWFLHIVETIIKPRFGDVGLSISDSLLGMLSVSLFVFSFFVIVVCSFFFFSFLFLLFFNERERGADVRELVVNPTWRGQEGFTGSNGTLPRMKAEQGSLRPREPQMQNLLCS